MKKSISNLGKVLEKAEQKNINGGTPPGIEYCLNSSCSDGENNGSTLSDCKCP